MAFEIKYENLNDVLDNSMRDFPDKVFVKYEDKVLTYQEFHEQVLRLANVFLSLGVKKGDYIGIQLANSIEFCVSIYACYRIGTVATPIISLWQAREVAEVVEKAKIDTFVIKGSITAVVNKVAKMESVQNIILVGDEEYDYPNIKGKFWDLIAAAAPDDPGIEVKREDLASCHFTAGTTGQSKGVLHDHLAYLYTGLVHLDTYTITHDDYSNLVLPMYHIYGFAQLADTVYSGGTIRMLDKFEPQALLKALEDPEMTIFCGVPSIYKMLVSQENVEDFTISPKIRLLISGAGALPPETEEAINERLLKGHGQVCQGYGSTEDCCVGAATFEKAVPGVIGKPEPGASIEYVDIDGNILPLGKENVGELVSQGPYVMIGYLGDPKAEDPVDHEMSDPVLRSIVGREGIWYWSGDIGYRDEDGVCFLTDRSRDIAKVSERLVYPSEVEAVLHTHEGVKEITVVGVPHEIYGEQLLAVIVPADPSADKDQLKQELQELAEKELAKYKIPRIWEFVAALQTNSLGKVLKRVYRDQFIKKMKKKSK